MDNTRDSLFDEALKIVQANGKASASDIQERLGIGYARASRIVDQLEESGYVSGTSVDSSRKPEVTTGKLMKEILFYLFYAGWWGVGGYLALSRDPDFDWIIRVVGFFGWGAIPYLVRRQSR